MAEKPKVRRWNPNAVRRCVRIQDATKDGIAMFASKSFTKAEAADAYHPAVDIQTGAVFCDCPHFTYRLAKHHPTIASGLCKHLERAVDNLRRRGLVQ